DGTEDFAESWAWVVADHVIDMVGENKVVDGAAYSSGHLTVLGPRRAIVNGREVGPDRQASSWAADSGYPHPHEVWVGPIDASGKLRSHVVVMRDGTHEGLDAVAELGDQAERAIVVTASGQASAETHSGWLIHSHDGGMHWTTPEPLADGNPVLV